MASRSHGRRRRGGKPWPSQRKGKRKDKEGQDSGDRTNPSPITYYGFNGRGHECHRNNSSILLNGNSAPDILPAGGLPILFQTPGKGPIEGSSGNARGGRASNVSYDTKVFWILPVREMPYHHTEQNDMLMQNTAFHRSPSSFCSACNIVSGTDINKQCSKPCQTHWEPHKSDGAMSCSAP